MNKKNATPLRQKSLEEHALNVKNFVNSFFDNSIESLHSSISNSYPKFNIKENETNFTVEVAAPGLNKEDFNVNVSDDCLIISSENKYYTEGVNQKSNYHKREFSCTEFSKYFSLPEDVDYKNIKAKYNHGILVLDIPKFEIKQKENITKIKID